jgi:hypothetical protein
MLDNDNSEGFERTVMGELNFYHTEVILEYPQYFTKGWFEFWGID